MIDCLTAPATQLDEERNGSERVQLLRVLAGRGERRTGERVWVWDATLFYACEVGQIIGLWQLEARCESIQATAWRRCSIKEIHSKNGVGAKRLLSALERAEVANKVLVAPADESPVGASGGPSVDPVGGRPNADGATDGAGLVKSPANEWKMLCELYRTMSGTARVANKVRPYGPNGVATPSCQLPENRAPAKADAAKGRTN